MCLDRLIDRCCAQIQFEANRAKTRTLNGFCYWKHPFAEPTQQCFYNNIDKAPFNQTNKSSFLESGHKHTLQDMIDSRFVRKIKMDMTNWHLYVSVRKQTMTKTSGLLKSNKREWLRALDPFDGILQRNSKEHLYWCVPRLTRAGDLQQCFFLLWPEDVN